MNVYKMSFVTKEDIELDPSHLKQIQKVINLIPAHAEYGSTSKIVIPPFFHPNTKLAEFKILQDVTSPS